MNGLSGEEAVLADRIAEQEEQMKAVDAEILVLKDSNTQIEFDIEALYKEQRSNEDEIKLLQSRKENCEFESD